MAASKACKACSPGDPERALRRLLKDLADIEKDIGEYPAILFRSKADMTALSVLADLKNGYSMKFCPFGLLFTIVDRRVILVCSNQEKKWNFGYIARRMDYVLDIPSKPYGLGF